jgi:TPR repeat protein
MFDAMPEDQLARLRVLVPHPSDVRPDALPGLIALANQENPMAMLFIAAIYSEGKIVPKDFAQTKHWLDIALIAQPPWLNTAYLSV